MNKSRPLDRATRLGFSPQRQTGLSLIELMIAMVIGLMTVLAITSLILNQASRQLLGGSINDAQNDALIAVSLIEKELHQAGLGLSSSLIQDCNRLLTSIDTGAGAAAMSNFDIMAVSLLDGGSGQPDAIRVRYAESVRGDQPLPLAANMANAVDNIPISPSAAYGIRTRDTVLLTNSANDCTLAHVSSITSGSVGPPLTPTLLNTAAVSSPSANTPSFNPASLPTGSWSAVTYTTALTSQVIILGQLTQRSYTVNTSTSVLSVQVQGSINSPPAPMVENVVDLQAQYGVSNDPTSDTVTQWVPATGSWVSPSATDRKRIKAIRFALITRTSQRDASKPTAAGNITLWPAATTGQTSADQTYNVAAGDAQEFRYRVLRMVVPLKNMLWAN